MREVYFERSDLSRGELVPGFLREIATLGRDGVMFLIEMGDGIGNAMRIVDRTWITFDDRLIPICSLRSISRLNKMERESESDPSSILNKSDV